jgi:hypothetical protein
VVEGVIERSGVVPFIESRIAEYQVKSGRPRELSVKALLVALLAGAREGNLYLIGVPGFLNSLSVRDRHRVGVGRTGRVTRRQVESLYGLICRALTSEGDYKYAGFDEVCQRLLSASADPDVRTRRDIAIDATSIASWGTNRRSRRAAKKNNRTSKDNESAKAKKRNSKTTKRETKPMTDPDARWRGKGENAWRRPVFGYDLTVAVTVPDRAGRPVPLAATSMRFRPAGTEVLPMALAVALDTATQRGGLDDVLADREYTQRLDGSDFVLPLRALGAEPIFQLKSTQQGCTGTQRGALVVDGQPYSQSLPTSLQNLRMPAVNAPLKILAEYQRKIGLREQYRLMPHGSRKPDGSQVYQCPASAGKLRCPLVASSQLLALGTMPAFPTNHNPMPGTVCTKKFTTFAASDLPLSQREQYGSLEWFMSMNRRNRVEGFFGNLKDQARENVNRGVIRVMGLVKTGLLVALAVTSLNLRLSVKWSGDSAPVPSKKTGRPRKVGVAAYSRAFAIATTGPPAS